MTWIQMGISGAAMIGVAAVFRALLLHRLPKQVFLVLWGIILARLLVPFSISSPFSIYGLLGSPEYVERAMFAGDEERSFGASGNPEYADGIEAPGGKLPGNFGALEHLSLTDDAKESDTANVQEIQTAGAQELYGDHGQERLTGPKEPVQKSSELASLFLTKDFWGLIWILGTCLAALSFGISYLRCLREFQVALPVEGTAREWLGEHLTADGRTPGLWRRPVSIRSLNRLGTPLTYGIFRPVILVPRDMDWSDRQAADYILEHEWVHICRMDALFKLFLALAVCVHWMNPLVWLMFHLANRDLELSCDEAVLRRLGEQVKSSYARMLISMEEKKSGLLPLYSGFGKNAVEERITAIMKHHRTSLGALLAAGVGILCVSSVFATSPRQEYGQKDLREALTQIPGDDFTREESQKLFDLWIEGYENMTVSDFQEQLWNMTDTNEYMELIDRFSFAELSWELPQGREADGLDAFIEYFFHVFEPLCAEKWQSRDFGDFIMETREEHGDPGILEYVLTLEIRDRNVLTVGSYEAVPPAVHEALARFLGERTSEELRDEEQMEVLLRQEWERIWEELDTEPALSLSLSWFYMPPSMDDAFLYSQISAEVQDEWKNRLEPYLPLGLTYTYTEDGNGGYVRMYYEGREVRGIWDEETGEWISDHTGLGRYDADAVELMAVRENGRLSGLREAAPQEQKEWDELRRENERASQEETFREEALRRARETEHGTRQDYDSLLKLRVEGYDKLSLEEFNGKLLDWCNENPEGMERIAEDVFLEDYQVSLTEEEKEFVSRTFPLSREENYRMVTSWQTGEPLKPAWVGSRKWVKQEESTGNWCTLYYQFSYEIPDQSRVTVGERDRLVGGMEKEIRRFWEDSSLQELLAMKEEQVAAYFQRLAEQYSTEQLVISIDEEQVQFEHRPEGYLLS
ncbi:MAG: M56 family metallopeptidase [Lachnospiraceae bacterium]|nr:M56 family metallopeptidase [Lachnospiraceae bacterium]